MTLPIGNSQTGSTFCCISIPCQVPAPAEAYGMDRMTVVCVIRNQVLDDIFIAAAIIVPVIGIPGEPLGFTAAVIVDPDILVAV